MWSGSPRRSPICARTTRRSWARATATRCLSIWSRLIGHGASGYRADVRASLARTDAPGRGAARGRRAGVVQSATRSRWCFPEPCEAIVRTYQLACNKGEAHAIVMPNVTDALIDRFVADYLAWWKASRLRPPNRSTKCPLRRSR